MNISYNFTENIDEILDIAYQKYCEEIAYHTFLEKKSKTSFSEFLNLKIKKMKCVTATENGRCVGVLAYSF